MPKPVEDSEDARPCSLPRAMVLERMRENELRELRQELALYEPDGGSEARESCQLLRRRIAELEAGAEPAVFH